MNPLYKVLALMDRVVSNCFELVTGTLRIMSLCYHLFLLGMNSDFGLTFASCQFLVYNENFTDSVFLKHRESHFDRIVAHSANVHSSTLLSLQEIETPSVNHGILHARGDNHALLVLYLEGVQEPLSRKVGQNVKKSESSPTSSQLWKGNL